MKAAKPRHTLIGLIVSLLAIALAVIGLLLV